MKSLKHEALLKVEILCFRMIDIMWKNEIKKKIKEGAFEDLTKRHLNVINAIIKLYKQEGPIDKEQLKQILKDDDMVHLL